MILTHLAKPVKPVVNDFLVGIPKKNLKNVHIENIKKLYLRM